MNGTYVLAPPPLGSDADAGNQQRGGQGKATSIPPLRITALNFMFVHRRHCNPNDHYHSRTNHASIRSRPNANRRLAVVQRLADAWQGDWMCRLCSSQWHQLAATLRLEPNSRSVGSELPNPVLVSRVLLRGCHPRER